MRYGPEHKQQTRQKVLHSAARALRRDGPGRVAVAEVMRAAGLTHGGFYAHFDSKEDLLAHAIDSMFDEVLAAFDKGTAGRPPGEALREYVSRYLTLAHCERRDSGCPIAALATDVPRMGEQARRAFEQGSARLASAIAHLLRELQVPDAGAAATSLLAELVGTLVLARCASDPATAERLLDASRSQALARFGL
jgi:TetR/AcrR family transcriptional repressor of nem operon